MRLILDGTVVRVRLDRKATSISLLVVLGVRADGQKVLPAIKSMDQLARVDRILRFFQRGDIASDMSESDIELCESLEQSCAHELPSDPPLI